MTRSHVQWTMVDLKLRREVYTRNRDLRIINISIVLVVVIVNEIT